MPLHSVTQAVDGLQEKGKGKLGTTKKGIGPTYSSKATRNGLRVSDLVGDFAKFTEKFETLVKYHEDSFGDLEIDKAAELQKYKVIKQLAFVFKEKLSK